MQVISSVPSAGECYVPDAPGDPRVNIPAYAQAISCITLGGKNV